MKIKSDKETHLIIIQRSPLDCNTLSPLHLQWSNTLRKKWNILGVKVPCYSIIDCIVIGKPSPTQKFFKVSEEKVLTGSQVWTLGQMVKLYDATFPYSSPWCAMTSVWVHCHEAAEHQPTTFHGVCLIFSRETTWSDTRTCDPTGEGQVSNPLCIGIAQNIVFLNLLLHSWLMRHNSSDSNTFVFSDGLVLT